jgi:hypothetical protein
MRSPFSSLYVGTHLEIHYKLMSFGLPSKAIPVDPSGVYKPGAYFKWLATQRAIEMGATKNQPSDDAISNQQLAAALELCTPSLDLQALVLANALDLDPERIAEDNASEAVNDVKMLEPGRFDVVFGRGRGAQERPGNARFRVLVDMHIEKYERANKFGKTEIANDIIRIIGESSGRFLKKSDGAAWEVVDDLTVRAKVSHAFRARRAQTFTGQSSSSSTPTLHTIKKQVNIITSSTTPLAVGVR